MRRTLLLVTMLAACGGGSGNGPSIPIVAGDAGTTYYGDPHSGNFWLGPVDYAETQWPNACGPANGKYPAAIQQLYGNYIMGLANEAQLGSLVAGNGALCDVCAELTANGKTLVAHVVTYGDEGGHATNIDVSPEIESALSLATSSAGTWRFVTCPTDRAIVYTFDGREWSNVWYFRVWVRNSRVPIAKVEYQLGAKAWAPMTPQTDGAWEIDSQDFSGGFSLRVTSIEGATIEDAIPGIGTFDPNAGIPSHGNF
jgi:hypothetical protein